VVICQLKFNERSQIKVLRQTYTSRPTQPGSRLEGARELVVSIHEEQVFRSSILESGFEMDLDLPENSELYLENGFWKLRLRDVREKADIVEKNPPSMENSEADPIWVGLATGPKGLTKKEALEMVRTILLSQLRHRRVAQQSSMTVSEFLERKFVPEYVASKGFFGRMHYQSMLKHVVSPEEVDRLFGVDVGKGKPRLRSVEDWPYLGHVPLRDVRTDSVQNLTSVALTRGYSTQTVAHIRNVVGTIFAHATKEMCFSGENPARTVQLPKVSRMQLPTLTRAEMARLINVMGYPEKEMALIAIVTGMTVAEICGLRWKRVNLSEREMLTADNEVIPPRTILVREEWIRGQLIDVAKKRNSSCRILSPLLPILRRLMARGEFTQPDDFVLVSRVGSPINPSNVLTRKLKPIGKEMKIPWLSWQHLRRLHRGFLNEFGIGFPDQMAGLVNAVSSQDFREDENWYGIDETELPY
jgi:integrase